MSTFDVNFKVKLEIGGEIVPLASEIIISTKAGDGVSSGFIFKLDRQPAAPPVSIYLGDLIDFIEKKMNAAPLSGNPGMGLISQAFSSGNQPGSPPINKGNFTSANQTIINVYEFSINSSKEQFLFSFNLDVVGSNPAVGFIPLPAELAGWLKIESLSITFSATKKKSAALAPAI